MLSNQAKWYLTGLKKTGIIQTGISGSKDPEPSAMEELIVHELVIKGRNFYDKITTYAITQKGKDHVL